MRSPLIFIEGLGLFILIVMVWRMFRRAKPSGKPNSLAAWHQPDATGTDYTSHYAPPDHHGRHDASHADHTAHCAPHTVDTSCVDTGSVDVGGGDSSP
jgi:ABC-type nickel/cobalt efflux system permease component RcnA